MTKLSNPVARRITSDWADLFPEFSIWQPLRLLRRIGPVVQGITLDKSTAGDQYYPTVHVHSLAQDFPVISLTLAQRLLKPSGVQQPIEVDRHPEEFRWAAVRLEEQSAFSLRRAPELSEIAEALRAFALAAQRGRLPAAVPELRDSVFIPAASGDAEAADESLGLVAELSEKWSKYEAPPGWTDTREWLDWLRATADDVPGLTSLVDGQIVKHKLSKIRSSPGSSR
ncbi:hypothetical protein OG607_33755 [Streptomyces sp. NBC_01537]|uniref:hypothetical protein n=1 Tax=Streptomyces sp. NBC_01537 TaxID=2903896 RepID=UPI003865A0D7